MRINDFILLTLLAIASRAQADTNYIVSGHDQSCATQGSGCRLGTGALSTTDQKSTQMSYHAEFRVSYRFTCTPSGTTSPSRITIFSSDDLGSRKSFNYNDAQTLLIEGMGPLRLEDTEPRDLADNYQPPGCGLYISVLSVKPSAWQIADWAAARVATLDHLNTVQRFYTSRPALLFWRTEYSARPDQFRGVIERTIQNLKSQLAGTCENTSGDDWNGDFVTCELIQNYQDILDQAPDARVDEAFAKIKAAATPIIRKGRQLVAAKTAAGLGDDPDLTQALDRVTTLIGP